MPDKKQLESNADAVMATADQTDDKVQKFCTIWTGIIRPVLELVKSFTGPKMDAQIAELEKAADGVCSGSNPDVANYCNIWNTLHLKAVLKMVQVFTGPKVDKAISTFIDVSDDLCPAS